MKDFPCQGISIYKWERCNLTLKGSPIINVGVRQWTYGLARSKYVRPSKLVRTLICGQPPPDNPIKLI